ncbi:MAG: universal stress protein [Actinobacteria bacterium]|nr:universal stress protein [Actinomycetota bacterium]MCA1721422.1 universal stress protein [Actinomycetota bacterium]
MSTASEATYSTVLVGTDGSESSFRAVDRAATVARDSGATLLLACAYRPMTAREIQDAADALGGESYKVSGSTPAEDVLRDAADRAKSIGAKDVDTLAVEGDPVDALVTLVDKRKVDLLVVGNRGLNSLAGRLLGSVPANISHRAACDVLIVHTTGKKK